jgi:DNA-binding IclR family transcriptional regulator
VHRLLARLERLQVVQRDPHSRRYHVGVRLQEVTRQSFVDPDPRQVARPYMEALRDQSGETVTLHMRDGTDQVVIEMYEGTQEVRWVAVLGRRAPLLIGPTATVVLAFLSAEQAEAVLKQTRTPGEPGPAPDTLAAARAAGFAVGTAALSRDTIAITVPVFERGGRVWGGLSIAGPAFRFTIEVACHLALSLQQAAASISAALGYLPAPRPDGVSNEPHPGARRSESAAHCPT